MEGLAQGHGAMKWGEGIQTLVCLVAKSLPAAPGHRCELPGLSTGSHPVKSPWTPGEVKSGEACGHPSPAQPMERTQEEHLHGAAAGGLQPYSLLSDSPPLFPLKTRGKVLAEE